MEGKVAEDMSELVRRMGRRVGGGGGMKHLKPKARAVQRV